MVRVTQPSAEPAGKPGAVSAASADHARAAEKRAAAAAGAPVSARVQQEIDALLEERRGYVQRGKVDRVAQVDVEITRRGGTPPSMTGGTTNG